MNPGDRVKMTPMWKYDFAIGTILKINKDDYVIVSWDGINGEWHYTPEQAKRLEVINEDA